MPIKKLNYGSITKFEKPIELSNDPIFADVNMDRYFKQGDSTTVDNEGNGTADDFFNTPPAPDNEPIEKIEIESKIPPVATDTGKPKKAEDKKPVSPAAKPVEDKTKKGDKPKTNNDY